MISAEAKSGFVKGLMRSMPVPGRYLDRILNAVQLDLASIPTPLVCSDRWNEFQVEVARFDTSIKKHIYFQGYFEWAETNFIRSALRPGQVFVDVGANIGWHTLVAANRVGPSGFVHAFEPVSKTFDELQGNVALNKFENVSLRQIGLSDVDGEIEIYGNKEDDSGGNTMFGGPDHSLIEVIRTRRGDDMLSELGIEKVHLLKVDVEGAEMHVLRGLGRFFDEGRIEAMMLEINAPHLRAAGTSPQAVLDFVQGKGFLVNDIKNPGQTITRLDDGDYMLNICCRKAGA